MNAKNLQEYISNRNISSGNLIKKQYAFLFSKCTY